jgi:hypothetical protein
METTDIAYEELRKKHDDKCKKDDKDDKDKCKDKDKYKKCKYDRRDHCHDHEKKHKHIHELQHTIKALSDQLAYLGRGHALHELLHVIKWPGWTTPAEFAFVVAILENIGNQVRLLERLQDDLVEASKKVANKRHKKDYDD